MRIALPFSLAFMLFFCQSSDRFVQASSPGIASNAESQLTLRKSNSAVLPNRSADSLLKLTLSAIETTCERSKNCKLHLEIQNVSSEDLEFDASLTIYLRPFRTDNTTDANRELCSVLNFNSLGNTGPNEYSKAVIRSNEVISRDIEIEKIGWLRSIQSSWEYLGIWDRVSDGKYQIYAGIGADPKTDVTLQTREDKTAEKAVGHADQVKIINVSSKLSARSNSMTIEFKK